MSTSDDDRYKKKVGENLRTLRNEMDLTQEEFVEIFNRKMKEKLKKTLSRGSYGPYEKGLRYPKKYIKLFAEFYGVTVGYLQGKELRYDLADIEKLTLNGRELSGKKLENALKYIEFLLADDD